MFTTDICKAMVQGCCSLCGLVGASCAAFVRFCPGRCLMLCLVDTVKPCDQFSSKRELIVLFALGCDLCIVCHGLFASCWCRC